MALEIERKFLVVDRSWQEMATATRYRQGYLCVDPERTVRVRQAGEQAFLTIKGKSVGAARSEYEYPIPVADAVELLKLCPGPLIEKDRYCIPYAGMTWEVDLFFGANEGLVLAEVELETPEQEITLPPWVGLEVTTDPRYFNAYLVQFPYTSWSE